MRLWPLLLLLAAGPAGAREALGVFNDWGAFQDAQPARCYAIAQPFHAVVKRDWQPFASVSHWPARKLRNQIHVRLSKERAEGAKVMLGIGDRQFELVAGRVDAWAPDARAEAAIVAAMRSGSMLSVRTREKGGGYFTDRYRLRGAATAIDAAAIACARR